jgi:hypothetical protein
MSPCHVASCNFGLGLLRCLSQLQHFYKGTLLLATLAFCFSVMLAIASPTTTFPYPAVRLCYVVAMPPKRSITVPSQSREGTSPTPLPNSIPVPETQPSDAPPSVTNKRPRSDELHELKLEKARIEIERQRRALAFEKEQQQQVLAFDRELHQRKLAQLDADERNPVLRSQPTDGEGEIPLGSGPLVPRHSPEGDRSHLRGKIRSGEPLQAPLKGVAHGGRGGRGHNFWWKKSFQKTRRHAQGLSTSRYMVV